MKRVGIYADVSNLYYCIGLKFSKGHKLDYQRYYDFIKDLGQIHFAKAYGAQIGSEAEGFIRCLKAVGYEAIYKTPKEYKGLEGKVHRKADHDVAIAVDMIENMSNIDLYVLGSADCDMCPVVQHLISQGKEVLVIAVGISGELRDMTSCIELPESLLENR